MAKQTQIEKAIAQLERDIADVTGTAQREIAVLQLAITKLKGQQTSKAKPQAVPTPKPRAVGAEP